MQVSIDDPIQYFYGLQYALAYTIQIEVRSTQFPDAPRVFANETFLSVSRPGKSTLHPALSSLPLHTAFPLSMLPVVISQPAASSNPLGGGGGIAGITIAVIIAAIALVAALSIARKRIGRTTVIGHSKAIVSVSGSQQHAGVLVPADPDAFWQISETHVE